MNCKALLNIAIEIALYKYCIIIIIIIHNELTITTVSILSPWFANENETLTIGTHRLYSYPSGKLFQSVDENLSWMHYWDFASMLE